jgi:hypothetical protein
MNQISHGQSQYLDKSGDLRGLKSLSPMGRHAANPSANQGVVQGRKAPSNAFQELLLVIQLLEIKRCINQSLRTI